MANIAINSVSTRAQYVATSSQTTFSYTFPIKADGDLKVYQRTAGSTPSDADDILVLTTDYTVTGANTASGGTVVLVVGATTGDIITIMGDKPIDRTAIYDQSVTLKKSDLNNDFNDNVMYDKQIDTEFQELGLKYDRSARITPSYREDNLKLPVLDDNEMWIGRGSAGDSPDDVTTVLVSTLTGLVLNEVDYIVGTAEPLLPNAQVLGTLATGLVKNTTAGSTGTVSIASQGTDYYAPTGVDVAVSDGGTGSSTAAGALTNLVTGTSVATATVAGDDKVLIQDTDSGDAIATVTAQSIADLAAGASEFDDATFRIQDNGDDTKELAFEVSAIASGTTRTITMPNSAVDLTPGTGTYQGSSARLSDIAGLAVTDSNIIVGDGANWVAESGSTARTSLGLTIGTDVQASSARLTDLAGLAVTDSNIIVGNGTNWVAEAGATARASLGLTIGTDVQASSARLSDIAGLAVTDSNVIVGNGTNWVAETGATARASLGLTIGSDVQAYDEDLTELASGYTSETTTTSARFKFLEGTDNGTNGATLAGPASTANVTLTLPSATDTLVGQATTDTLTNKSIDVDSNTLSNVPVSSLANSTAGELITWSDLGVPDVVSAGTSGHVLTSNGAGFSPTFQASAGGSSKLVQTVNTIVSSVATGTTIIPNDDSIPQNSEGDQYMTLSVTPTSATNDLIITVGAIAAFSASNAQITMALFQDSTADALSASCQREVNANDKNTLTMQYFMAAGTTSSTTFKIRIGAESSGTTTFNGHGGSRKFGGVANSFITIQEVE